MVHDLTEPLHDKCAPDSVKYRVRQRRNSLHFPFFSFSCPSIIGWFVPCKNPAFSGWLQRKQPHWYSSSLTLGLFASVRLTSNTSKKPECRNSFTNDSCSLTDGKLLVTSSVKLLFSVLIIFHIFFRLLMPGSRVLSAQLSFTYKKSIKRKLGLHV